MLFIRDALITEFAKKKNSVKNELSTSFKFEKGALCVEKPSAPLLFSVNDEKHALNEHLFNHM